MHVRTAMRWDLLCPFIIFQPSLEGQGKAYRILQNSNDRTLFGKPFFKNKTQFPDIVVYMNLF